MIDIENEIISQKEMRTQLKLLKSNYNKALIDITNLNNEINQYDEDLNEQIEELENNNQIPSPLRSSEDDKEIIIKEESKSKFQRNSKAGGNQKLEIIQLNRAFKKELESIESIECAKTEQEIEIIQKLHLERLNKLSEDNDKLIKETQSNIRQLQETIEENTIDKTQHLAVVKQMEFEHNNENIKFQSLIMELNQQITYNLTKEDISILLNRINNTLGSYNTLLNSKVMDGMSISDNSNLFKLNINSLSNTNANNPKSSNRYSNNSKSDDSEVSESIGEEEENYDVENEFSNSDSHDFEIDDCVDEIRINKVNCLKIDSEFFEKKNRFFN